MTSVWSSAEAKAIEAAGILAARLGVGVNVDEDLGENDRTATGFLPPDEFETVVDAFFAEPEKSIRGWSAPSTCSAVARMQCKEFFLDMSKAISP